MARKSKGKFNMKGHTLPGINQISETSNVKDGRSPSSAFQMKSPLQQEDVDDTQMEFAEIETPEIQRDLSLEKGDTESGWAYLSRQLGIRNYLKNKAKEQQKTDPSKTQEDQTEKYDTEGMAKQYDVAPEDMIQDASGNWIPKEGAKSLTYGDTWSEGGWKDDATTKSEVGDPPEKLNEQINKYDVMPDHPGDKDYSYRRTPDGGYEYSYKGGDWITAEGKGLEAIKERYDRWGGTLNRLLN